MTEVNFLLVLLPVLLLLPLPPLPPLPPELLLLEEYCLDFLWLGLVSFFSIN